MIHQSSLGRGGTSESEPPDPRLLLKVTTTDAAGSFGCYLNTRTINILKYTSKLLLKFIFLLALLCFTLRNGLMDIASTG